MNVLQEIHAAATRLQPYLNPTLLTYSQYFSHLTGCEVYLKCEHLQATGSFKIRGALNRILSLTPQEKAQGVIAASTGNHGLAVAFAAKLAKVPATIFLPETTPAFKLNAITWEGVHIQLVPGDCLAVEKLARQKAQSQNKTFISPYNDLQVIAGQGTIGVELADAKLDAVFISMGGGGLLSGIGTFLKSVSPATQMIACWPENAPALYECLKAGKIIEVPEKPTLSDATAGGLEPNAITLELCQKLIDKQILISENDLKSAMRLAAEYEHWIIEGAAAVALGAFLNHATDYTGKKVGIVICGRNIAFETFQKATQ